MTTDTVDVLIIGAGASAAAFAWSLADTRMQILCLEQGDWANPSDYPTTGMDWERQQLDTFNFNPNGRLNQADYPLNEDDSAISVARRCHWVEPAKHWHAALINWDGTGGQPTAP